MRYVIRCEKCGRPADVEKRIVNWKNGQPTTKTTYKNTCVICGGKVKALLD